MPWRGYSVTLPGDSSRVSNHITIGSLNQKLTHLKRRIKIDSCMYFTILNKMIDLDISNFFKIAPDTCVTRWHSFKLLKVSKCNNDEKLLFKQPSSILDLLKIQPTHSTRSSAVVTLQRPANPSRLKITDRSFYHQAPALWNSLPKHLLAHSAISPTQTNYSLLSLSSSQFHNWKPTFSFNPILPRPSLPRTDTLKLESAWFTRHSHSIPFIIHQHIIHRIFLFYTRCQQCTGISWQKIIFVSFIVHFKSSSSSHIINFTSFRHIFCWSYMNGCFNEDYIIY